ncbi:MAG: hypothetical protein K0V04_19990 [Deltaproteobacteria bacterium]|nr:hypothetical protein [Deltaproteobacteria bacterium]
MNKATKPQLPTISDDQLEAVTGGIEWGDTSGGPGITVEVKIVGQTEVTTYWKVTNGVGTMVGYKTAAVATE